MKGFIVCVCTKQTCLYNLCSAAETASHPHSMGRSLIPPGLSSPPTSSPPPLYSFLRIKWLFVLLQRRLSLVSPPLPSLSPFSSSSSFSLVMKRCFFFFRGERDGVCPEQIPKEGGYPSPLCINTLVLWKNLPPPLHWRVSFNLSPQEKLCGLSSLPALTLQFIRNHLIKVGWFVLQDFSIACHFSAG